MAHAIEVVRRDRSSAELRRDAKRFGDRRVACRILAIAHVLDGMSRTDAARACGMDRQTLWDWVHRYNAVGIAGLADAPRGGRPPASTSEQMAKLRRLVLAGPDPARDGVVRDDRHDSAWLFGAICPERAVGAAVVMPWVSSEVMSMHLTEISKVVGPAARCVLVCDGAGSHQSGDA